MQRTRVVCPECGRDLFYRKVRCYEDFMVDEYNGKRYRENQEICWETIEEISEYYKCDNCGFKFEKLDELITEEVWKERSKVIELLKEIKNT